MAVDAAHDAALPDTRESGPLREASASDDTSPRRPGRLPAAIFGAIALVIGLDVASDLAAGAELLHLVLEALGFVLAMGGLAWMAVQFVRAANEARNLRVDVVRAREDATRWREEAQAHLQGLGAAIDRQLEAWQLTPAEREIALLLLKGLSLQEIAKVRGTSERTTRQQSLAVYRKAGVAGRAELSAFFLEDLLLPVKR